MFIDYCNAVPQSLEPVSVSWKNYLFFIQLTTWVLNFIIFIISSIISSQMSETTADSYTKPPSPSFGLDFTMSSAPSSPSFLSSPTNQSSVRLQVEDEEELIESADPDDSIYIDESFISVDEDESEMNMSPITWSRQTAEAFIDKQTHLLQINKNEAVGCKELHDIIQAILLIHPHLPAAYYLMSLNYLRVKEARLSLQALTAAYDTQQVCNNFW